MTELLLFTFSVSQSDSYFPILYYFQQFTSHCIQNVTPHQDINDPRIFKPLVTLHLSRALALLSSVTVNRSQAVSSCDGEVKRCVVRDESIFGAVAGEAVLTTMICVLYFVEISILVCILWSLSFNFRAVRTDLLQLIIHK